LSAETSLWRRIARTLILWLISVAVFMLIASWRQDITVQSLLAAGVFVIIVSALNALLWPVISYVALPLLVLTVGLGSLILNTIIVKLAADFMPNTIQIESWWAAFVVSLGLTIATMIGSTIMSLDDDGVYQRNMIQRFAKRARKGQALATYPGVIFLEIDGLARPILERAMENGFMPNLARWQREHGYVVSNWHTDLSSQTGAAQAGILLGHNHDIPAFQWVDKSDHARYVASSSIKDAVALEGMLSDKNGVLAHHGLSIGNLFSGDAEVASMTFSRVTGKETRASVPSYYGFFASPYNVLRGLVNFVRDLWVEWRSKARFKHFGRPIVGKRKHLFPFERAATNGIMQDIYTDSIIGNIYAGVVDSVYATYTGYDVNAHACGIEGPDALDSLVRLDRYFSRIKWAAERADRKYLIVVLSDHGQSKGLNFTLRYGQSLEEFIQSLVPAGMKVYGGLDSQEGWAQVSVAMTELSKDESQTSAKFLRRFTRNRTEENGEVKAGPLNDKQREVLEEALTHAPLVVIGSGNLAPMYFANEPERLTREQIDAKCPNLIAGILRHPSTGWLMVKQDDGETMVLGPTGKLRLSDGAVLEGADPLAVYGPHALRLLQRYDSFTNCPDLALNGFYDPDHDDAASYEEQMGFHGGLGGLQNRPFVFHPKSLAMTEELVGAEMVHNTFVRWLGELRGGPTPG
jgi:uncharacterized membrane protein YvlD (DUF360 family)